MREIEINKKQYIEAAFAVLDTEGPQALSIRRLAQDLHCNPANLYRYFKGLDELALYASLHYLRKYLEEVQAVYRDNSDPLTIHMKIWESFAHHSFRMPKLWNNIFFGKHCDRLDAVLQDYYDMFPEDMGTLSEPVRRIYRTGDFNHRNYMLVLDCVEAGYFTPEDGRRFNALSIYLYKGFLKECLDDLSMGRKIPVEEYKARFLYWLNHLLSLCTKDANAACR